MSKKGKILMPTASWIFGILFDYPTVEISSGNLSPLTG